MMTTTNGSQLISDPSILIIIFINMKYFDHWHSKCQKWFIGKIRDLLSAIMNAAIVLIGEITEC